MNGFFDRVHLFFIVLAAAMRSNYHHHREFHSRWGATKMALRTLLDMRTTRCATKDPEFLSVFHIEWHHDCHSEDPECGDALGVPCEGRWKEYIHLGYLGDIPRMTTWGHSSGRLLMDYYSVVRVPVGGEVRYLPYPWMIALIGLTMEDCWRIIQPELDDLKREEERKEKEYQERVAARGASKRKLLREIYS